MTEKEALQILVITSRPLVDSFNRRIVLLDAEQERARVRDALQKANAAIHAHFLPDATTGAVTEILARDWDVVHITGHGSHDGRLWFENEYGVAHAVNARDVVQMFGANIPRVVVLSLCYSGKTLPEALLDAGVRTVIAIDADEPIPDLAATLFNETFYGMLAWGKTVRESFERAQTRVRVDSQVGDEAFSTRGEIGIPHSERFNLGGNGAFAFPNYAGAYQETGAPRVLGNLRARNRNFVGRAKEIVEIVTALDARGGLQNAWRGAVWGSGGLGKTELAQAVGWWYVERGRVDAVLWASASPAEDVYVLRDLASLLAIAARAFGLNFSEQMPFEQQQNIVREFFAAHNALLILDNWETLEGRTRKELWDFVKELNARVLVTSRDILPSRDAVNIELDTLASDDAASLFITIARNGGYFDKYPDWREEVAALGKICDRLGGYALAIEVVAGQASSRRVTAIWEDLLRIPKNALEGKDELTGEPRGVWTSLDFSYNILPESDKVLFRNMCVFLVPASVEDIGAISLVENPRSVLDRLVARSLVRMRDSNYALHPIVRDYAESKMVEAGEKPSMLHLAAAQYYGKKGTWDGAMVASEHWFELGVRYKLPSAAKHFVEYVMSFYPRLEAEGHWSDARYKAQQVIRVARNLNDKQTEAMAIEQLANLSHKMGEYEHAYQLHGQARKIFEWLGDKQRSANALSGLAMEAQARGDFTEAERLYQQSLKDREESDDEAETAATLLNLGNLKLLQGYPDEAKDYLERSLTLHGQSEDKMGMAAALHELGLLAKKEGNLDEAKNLFERSLELEKEVGNKSGIAISLAELGSIQIIHGSVIEAERLLWEGLKAFEELGSKREQANILLSLGHLALKRGNHAEAKQRVRQGLDLLEELGDRKGVANALFVLGMIMETIGDYSQARDFYDRSQKLSMELGARDGMALAASKLGHLEILQGNHFEALIPLLVSLPILYQMNSPLLQDVFKDVKKARDAISPEKFGNLMEIMTVGGMSNSPAQIYQWLSFLDQMKEAANGIIYVYMNGTDEQRHEAARLSTLDEKQLRERNMVEVAEFIRVLRGLLLDEDVNTKITSLSKGLKEIAEETQKMIRESEAKRI